MLGISDKNKPGQKPEDKLIPRITQGPLPIFKEYTMVVLGDLGVGKTSLIKNAKECRQVSKHFTYPGKVTRDEVNFLTDKGMVRLSTYQWGGALNKKMEWPLVSREMFPTNPDCVLMVYNRCDRKSMMNVIQHLLRFFEFMGYPEEKMRLPKVVVGTHSNQKYKRPDDDLERLCSQQRIQLVKVDNPTGEGCDRPFQVLINHFGRKDNFVLVSRTAAKWPSAAYNHELVKEFIERQSPNCGVNSVLPDLRCLCPYDHYNSRWFAPPAMNSFDGTDPL